MTVHKPILSIAAALLAVASFAQMQRIVLQGGGTPQVFTSINDALAAAQPNDKLYFSGGSFASPAELVIGMPLHFVGAGIHPDSTEVTSTTTITTEVGYIRFTTGASGSTFTGIRFDPQGYLQYGTSEADDDPTGMVFQRCEFEPGHLLQAAPAGATSSTLYDECIFRSFITGQAGTTATFTRCIFEGTNNASIGNFDTGGLLVSHCVFLDGVAISGCLDAIAENCVFTNATYPIYQCNNVMVTNCLVTSNELTGNSSGEISVNNQFGVPAANIFVNETDNNYQFTDDLHLAPGSTGIGGADDGTDIGIYGSSSPCKPGNVPYNPHYRAASIATTTNPNGELPVNIRVAAQTN